MFKSAKDKDGSRQATLFGMMPRAFQTSQTPKQRIEDKQIVNEEEDVGEEMLDMPEAMEETDSQMTLNDSRGLGDTQVDEETQMD